ncbi:MAG: hypothetical protein VW405_16425 [Rhodospirillaceae bacterium]
MKRLLASAAIAALFALGALPAAANSCPKDMKAIDAALAKSPSLSAAQMGQVTKLRAEGEAFHKAGKHADSVRVLHEAMGILEIK